MKSMLFVLYPRRYPFGVQITNAMKGLVIADTPQADAEHVMVWLRTRMDERADDKRKFSHGATQKPIRPHPHEATLRKIFISASREK